MNVNRIVVTNPKPIRSRLRFISPANRHQDQELFLNCAGRPLTRVYTYLAHLNAGHKPAGDDRFRDNYGSSSGGDFVPGWCGSGVNG